MAGGVAHPLHLLLQNHSCCKGPLVGIPCKGHHLLIHVSVHGSELLIYTTVHDSKCHMRIRLRGISQQLHLFPLWLCRWPLKLEALLYGTQDPLTEALLCCLFTSASSELVNILVQVLNVLAYSQDQQAPWQWVLPLDLIWAVAPSGPIGWHSHSYSSLLQQHTGTSADTDTHGGGHCVPITAVHEDRHQHLTAILPPSQKCFVLLPGSWQWQFLQFCSHIIG